MSPVMQSSWRGPLDEDIQRYVRYKRALGHRYLIEESALHMLDRFLRERQVDQVYGVNPELIEAFLASRRRRTARSHNHLLGVIRCFFDWLVVQERIAQSQCESAPGAQVPGRCRSCSIPCGRSACSTSLKPFPIGPRVPAEDPPITSSSR